MEYTTEDSCKDLQIAYVGGGSRGWAWNFMTDLAMDPQVSGTIRLYDIDRKAAECNRIIGEKITRDPQARSSWHYEVSADLAGALTGADICVISILPGTFTEMRSDVHAPEKYGIYQPVGDTVGPGGFMRALRSIPMFAEIGTAIRDYAPNAWVINYTNPMTLCVRALYEVFPEIKAFGCCHEVFGTQNLLCQMLSGEYGREGIRRQDLDTTVIGVNHFTWMTAASYKGQDLFPLYSSFAAKYAADGYTVGRDPNWLNSFFRSAQRVKFDLFLKYGLIAAAGDRHLAEFMPHPYLDSPDAVRQWGFGLTPVAWREENLQERLERSNRLISGEELPNMESSGEEGHLLIKALLGLGSLITNVNIPNRGQISNLPLGAVVETNAYFSRDRLDPLFVGGLPPNLHPIFERIVCNHENTLTAALTCNRELALETFMNDPQMNRITIGDGKQLFEDMLSAQKQYLPSQWFA